MNIKKSIKCDLMNTFKINVTKKLLKKLSDKPSPDNINVN